MAQGLSLLIQVRGQASAASGLTNALSANAGGDGPNILHYVWSVPVPRQDDPPGVVTVLLTTVYDEDFQSYIRDLVLANPKPFNDAAKLIVGLEDMTPVEDHLSDFIEFVREHDLTQGGTLPFVQAYPYTVVAIEDRFADG